MSGPGPEIESVSVTPPGGAAGPETAPAAPGISGSAPAGVGTLDHHTRFRERLSRLEARLGPRRAMAARFAFEALVVLTLLWVYSWSRVLVAGQVGAAFENAHALVSFEQWAHLYVEPAVQAFFLQRDPLIRAMNWYYEWVHFPGTALFLVWAFWRYPSRYPTLRNTLAISTLLAFVLHWWYPLAPPRFVEVLGIRDTLALYQHGLYEGYLSKRFANQLAAMPSLHFGWSLFIGIAVPALSKHPLRWVFALHPVITFLTIVATGNHFVLDALVAVPLMWGAYKLATLAHFQHVTGRLGEAVQARPRVLAGATSLVLVLMGITVFGR